MTDNPGFISKDDDLRRHPSDEESQNYTPDVTVCVNEGNDDGSSRTTAATDLIYGIDDNPPWYLCILLSLQQCFTALGSIVATSFILAYLFCLGPNDVGTAEMLSTLIFVSGLVTVLQSTIGTRLPILQGGSFAFVAPVFAILGLSKWKCPAMPDYSNSTLYNETMRAELEDFKGEVWHSRMREIQGAIILSSLFEVVIGGFGIMGILLNYIGPLAIAPTISLIGVSLFGAASTNCEGQWWIAIATVLCITVFSQFLSRCKIPCYRVASKSSGDKGCVRSRGVPFFTLFPILFSMLLMWLVCYILTITDTLPPDPQKWGYLARTDIKSEVLRKAKWFRFPYPFQWGVPTFSIGGVFGMLAGVLAGMVESIGDYYSCARLSGAPPPPIHAINRGLTVEGVGCVLAGMWGSGNGTTSYSGNIGAIGITKVGSRIVIQVAGLIMLLLGMLGKFGALFVAIPPPIIGGVFMVTFGMVVAVGLSNLQYVNMNSSRNLFIVGFAIFFGLSLPQWMAAHPNSINTGSEVMDQIFSILLRTGMFVGGSVGFILDNTIPGTVEERGIKAWRQHKLSSANSDGEVSMECYDLPWCMSCIRRVACFRYLPFCPTFSYSPSCSCRGKTTSHDLHLSDDAKSQSNLSPEDLVGVGIYSSRK